MKKISVLSVLTAVSLLMVGCDNYEPIKVHYFVQAETPITITYTDCDSQVVTVKTDLLDYSAEINESNCPDNFYYQISWVSETVQRVDMVVEFDGDPQIDQTWTSLKTLTDKLYYCTPWGSKCIHTTL